MNINLRLSGELERFIASLIDRGIVENKTEAARMLIARQYLRDRTKDLELGEWQRHATKTIWDNQQDNIAEKFYVKRYMDDEKA